MQRYMIHLRNTDSKPKDAVSLLSKARLLVKEPGIVVRDTRVSSRYIEFDTSIAGEEQLAYLLGRLEAISPVANYEHVVERHLEKKEAISRAVQLFNDEKYWGAHELLEGVWKSSEGCERDILNGIILVAAAFVHDEKDEQDICKSILRRAIRKLDGKTGVYYGIDLDMLSARLLGIVNSGKIERFSI